MIFALVAVDDQDDPSHHQPQAEPHSRRRTPARRRHQGSRCTRSRRTPRHAGSKIRRVPSSADRAERRCTRSAGGVAPRSRADSAFARPAATGSPRRSTRSPGGGGTRRDPGPTMPGSGPSGRVSSERRLVSVLFCDLVDSPVWPNRSILKRYATCCRATSRRPGDRGAIRRGNREVHRRCRSGRLGQPGREEDDAERAVRSALEIVAAVPELRRPV